MFYFEHFRKFSLLIPLLPLWRFPTRWTNTQFYLGIVSHIGRFSLKEFFILSTTTGWWLDVLLVRIFPFERGKTPSVLDAPNSRQVSFCLWLKIWFDKWLTWDFGQKTWTRIISIYMLYMEVLDCTAMRVQQKTTHKNASCNSMHRDVGWKKKIIR